MSSLDNEGRDYLVPPENTEGQGASGEAAGISFEPSAESLAQLEPNDGTVERNVREAREATAEAIRERTSRQDRGPFSATSLSGGGNIQGIAVGPPEPDSESAPGTQVLHVYVAEPMTVDQARTALVDALGVDAAREAPLRVVHSGIIDAFSHRFRSRPTPGGVSVHHYQDAAAGTLGCLAFGRSGAAANKVLCLSNNHVLARVNSSRIGDCIVQPGGLDGGSCPADQIAVLEKFAVINLVGKPNYVDCATGWCFPDRVRPDLVYIYNGAIQFFRISNVTRPASFGLPVGKSGRTTQLTYAAVESTSWSGQINYGGRLAFFDRQLSIRNPAYQFSAPGDSGSIVWGRETPLNPVGLLFAGSQASGYTFANPIDWVLSAMDIHLLT
ncbi:S1 family peptidase [Streptomyces sp. C10-9-1]|uniref:S1 family peptidase n=1 Tax=Streptomyces sp. C10-9-1 TaxID=1859285 RepID=UPI0021119381|nr:S1 family peptidase [Streptomyces sp. C10-9-1]MCQ6556828.1 S1 family peptidase [Streptomyces sp. C10-9-1]